MRDIVVVTPTTPLTILTGVSFAFSIRIATRMMALFSGSNTEIVMKTLTAIESKEDHESQLQ
jgi:hypothetical protein